MLREVVGDTSGAHHHLPLRCAARCGAFVHERRVVVGAGGRETLSQSLGAVRLCRLPRERTSEDGGGCARQGCRRPSLGRVAANGSKFAPSGPDRYLPLRCARALRSVRRCAALAATASVFGLTLVTADLQLTGCVWLKTLAND